MAQGDDKSLFIRVTVLCLLWYTTSSLNGIIGKTLLNDFPFPMTLTMVQLLSVAFYSGPLLKYLGVRPRKNGDISVSYFKRLILPLSLGKFIATVFAHISLWRVPVSYAHTVKATMPLFTVIVARICIGEKQTLKVYCSLVPIFLGVAIATITEISFDMFGLGSALFSTLAFALLTIYSKKVLLDTGIHSLRLLHLLGKLALAMFTPFWLYCDVSAIMNDHSWVDNRDPAITSFLLFMDGFLNWIQNLIAFTLLHLVTPLTYAVANTSKRICIITLSLFVMGNPVTLTNGFGMILAVIGVFGYNKSKYDANQEKAKFDQIPLSRVTSSYRRVPHPAFADATQPNSSEILAQYFPNPLQTPSFYSPFPMLEKNGAVNGTFEVKNSRLNVRSYSDSDQNNLCTV